MAEHYPLPDHVLAGLQHLLRRLSDSGGLNVCIGGSQYGSHAIRADGLCRCGNNAASGLQRDLFKVRTAGEVAYTPPVIRKDAPTARYFKVDPTRPIETHEIQFDIVLPKPVTLGEQFATNIESERKRREEGR